jgi:hypothetical protein
VKGKLAVMIVALMITSAVFGIFTPVVSAAHAQTSSVNYNLVKSGAPTELMITVLNKGPDPIDNVTIIVPSEFAEFHPAAEWPPGWDNTKIDNRTVEWIGSTDNITENESLAFRFGIETPTAAGIYTISVRTKDIYGVENESFVTVQVDNTAPTVAINYINGSPVPVGGYTTDETAVEVSGVITIDNWETYETGPAAVTAVIQLQYDNSVVQKSITIDPENHTFSVTVENLREGNNTIIVSATDSVGNTSFASITVVRVVTSWATYVIITVIVVLVLAAIVILRKR